MTAPPRLWMRHETRETERRAPLVPEDAGRLVERGLMITVEDSPQRVFPASDYADAGCAIAAPGSWVDAPADSFILGLKELPDSPVTLRHRHVFFGHAYKGQPKAAELLRRFTRGGGALLDLEYLTDRDGRRLAAFGYWAGYAGAAVAVQHLRGRLTRPLRPTTKDSMDAGLRPEHAPGDPIAKALVIGALGRCGRGARDALAVAGIATTCWDIAETRSLDRPAILEHDLLVNAVLATDAIPPFLTRADLDDGPRRLRMIADVACDVGSPCNVLPVYDSTTSWDEPVRRLRTADPPLDIVSIDNLPALLPRESSIAFSAGLAPHLTSLGTAVPHWRRCLSAFYQARDARDRPNDERAATDAPADRLRLETR
jgi:saccharopine dehydrogenase (NAD+, L-lysine forming)